MYDFADGRLRKAGGFCVCCLLMIAVTDLKTRAVASPSYKIRRETEVGSGVRLSRILQTPGTRETFRDERYRTVCGRRVRPGPDN